MEISVTDNEHVLPLRDYDENDAERYGRELEYFHARPRRYENRAHSDRVADGNGKSIKAQQLQATLLWGLDVARDGIEPPTRGFSVLCSTD